MEKLNAFFNAVGQFFAKWKGILAEKLEPLVKKLDPLWEKLDVLKEKLQPLLEPIAKRLEPLKPYWEKFWPKARRPVTIMGFLFMFGALGIWGFYLSVRWGAFEHIPSKSELRNIKNYEASEIYSADGVLLGRYYLEDRTNVAYDKISEHVINALISTEDARFYKHGGVDIKSVLRVLFKSLLLRDESSGGGSTISQQLAKNLFPRQPHGIFTMPIAKIKEMIIAGRLEDLYSKKEILTMYLNTVSFGDNAFGIDRAAYRFFNKTAAELSIEEAAVLVGLLKATTRYNPRRYPERSKDRRNRVLEQIVIYGNLPEAIGDSLQALPLTLNYNLGSQSEGLAPYFREHLRLELNDWVKDQTKSDGSPYNLYTDGLKIYTTLDSRLQAYAEEAVKAHMTDLQKTFEKHWEGRRPWGKNLKEIEKAVASSERYKKRKKEGWTQEQLNKDFQTKYKMTIFTWEGEKEVEMSPIDSIIHYLYFLNTGFLAMDPGNGQVKAWVGGINHQYFKYDHTRAKRQAGSTFKPILYATALNNGTEPCSYYPNEQIEYTEYDNWMPGNSDDMYGGEYSMVGGLVNSVNTIAVQLIMETGVDDVVKMAKNMGVAESDIPKVPSIALGTPEVSLFEMVQVYSTLANKGHHVKPVYLASIEDRRGRLIERFETRYPEKKQVMHVADAALMVEMMKKVVDEGTGKRLRYKYKLTNDIAGKTGTTQSHADGWFIGATPKLVAGAWVGGANNQIRFRSISLGQGANMALPIWGEFFQRVNKNEEFKTLTSARFAVPDTTLTNRLDCTLYNEPLDTLHLFDDNILIIERDGKPDIIINQNPKKGKKKNRSEKEKKETKKLREKLRDLFKKKNR